MTAEEIDELFQEKIKIKGIEKKATTPISKNVMYNYRNRPTLSLGHKIEFLFNINAISIQKNESQGEA